MYLPNTRLIAAIKAYITSHSPSHIIIEKKKRKRAHAGHLGRNFISSFRCFSRLSSSHAQVHLLSLHAYIWLSSRDIWIQLLWQRCQHLALYLSGLHSEACVEILSVAPGSSFALWAISGSSKTRARGGKHEVFERVLHQLVPPAHLSLGPELWKKLETVRQCCVFE